MEIIPLAFFKVWLLKDLSTLHLLKTVVVIVVGFTAPHCPRPFVNSEKNQVNYFLNLLEHQNIIGEPIGSCDHLSKV